VLIGYRASLQVDQGQKTYLMLMINGHGPSQRIQPHTSRITYDLRSLHALPRPIGLPSLGTGLLPCSLYLRAEF